MNNTTSEKVSAGFIGFFTFIGVSLAVFLLVFLVTTFTLVEGRTAPWLQPLLPWLLAAAPVAGIGTGVYTALRYLRSQRAKRQQG